MKAKTLNIVWTIFIGLLLSLMFNFQQAKADIGFGTDIPIPTIGAGADIPVSTTSGASEASSGSIPLPAKPANLPSPSLDDVVTFAIKVIWAIGQIGFVVVLLVGGVMFITSAGDESKAEKAKKLILYAIIGLVVMLAAWGISSFLITSFK